MPDRKSVCDFDLLAQSKLLGKSLHPLVGVGESVEREWMNGTEVNSIEGSLRWYGEGRPVVMILISMHGLDECHEHRANLAPSLSASQRARARSPHGLHHASRERALQ